MLPDINTQLRLPYPTEVTFDLNGEPHKISGELISVSDDGTTRRFIIRAHELGQDIHFTVAAGPQRIETVYDEHGVKWARTL